MRLRLPGRSPEPETPSTGPSEDPDAVERAADDDLEPGATVTRAPAPRGGRGPKVHRATQKLAILSAEFLLIAAAVVAFFYVLGKLWSILLPLVLGLLIATVLWPTVRFLRRHSWPPALAAGAVLLTFLAAFGGLIAVIAPQVADQVTDLADAATAALQSVQEWLQGPPLNLGEDQIGEAVDSVIDSIQGNAQDIAGYALTGASAVGNSLITLVLALVLVFFFLKDGTRWVPWLSAQTGHRAAPHVAALSYKTWATLSEFIRQQALVGFIDAFFIGLGLWILGVPLVIPLAVLTFFGGFIPIIGAFVAGAFAVLIALVSNGVTTAIIVLVIVLVVQQVEGNVLQPIIQGRGFNLHAAVVILAVTAGGSLAGIIGAFLSVPIAALVAVIYRYIRDVLDDKSPEIDDDGQVTELVGNDSGATVRHTPAAVGQSADDQPADDQAH